MHPVAALVLVSIFLFDSIQLFGEDERWGDQHTLNQDNFFVLESRQFPGFYLSAHCKKIYGHAADGPPHNCWTDAQMWRDRGNFTPFIQFRIKMLKNGLFIPLEEEIASLKRSVASLEARLNDVDTEEIDQLLWEKLSELETNIQRQNRIIQSQQAFIDQLKGNRW